MGDGADVQADRRRQAQERLARLSPAEREAILIKNWMSHDARWFMAVADEVDLETTNRINRNAAREVGKAETRRLVEALDLPPVGNMSDYLQTQETMIGLLGPDLIDYRIIEDGSDVFQMEVRRCFAYENAARAGVLNEFGCGILARVTGWITALGMGFEVDPPLTACLKARGRQCRHTVTLTFQPGRV